MPSLHPSQLAKRLREFGPPPEGSSTLWEMASYAEREGKSKFLVPALNLPPTEVCAWTQLVDFETSVCKNHSLHSGEKSHQAMM